MARREDELHAPEGGEPPPAPRAEDDAVAEGDADQAGATGNAVAAGSRTAGRFLDGAAGRIFVRSAGEEGPALVLVHGLGGAGTQWRPQLAALAPDLRLFAPDLRGHGRSERPADGAYGIAAHAADVVALADALGLDRFALAGHSFGAWVALEVAAVHPDRVFALALVDPGGDTSGEPSAAIDTALAAVRADPRHEFTVHYREFLHGVTPATARRDMADLDATPVEALVTGIHEAMRYPARARLAAYPGPVLCIAGPLNDTPGSLTRTVEGLATEWLAPASHWLMLDRPAQTSGLLADFVGAAAARDRRPSAPRG
jgi:pimeloyl-ACP methyl ester carboxylesterase